MARLPRLVVPGVVHVVVWRALDGLSVFADDDDRALFLEALRAAIDARDVQLLAWALPDHEVQLLLRPETEEALARTMQTLGRRFVAAYNRRHRRSGTLWDGRFRTAVIEPGVHTLQALQLVDALATEAGSASGSASSRLGGRREPMLRDPPEYWALGNTPFDREAAYRELLAQGLPAAVPQALARALRSGWIFGSPAFVRQIAQAVDRPAEPRPRGRPRRA